MPDQPDPASRALLPSIDPTSLETVTGGAAADAQVVALLQSVMTSIKDLAQSRSQGSGDAFMQMMPLMMMMRGSQSPAAAPAAPAAAAPACPCQAGGDGWIKVT